MRPAVIVSEKKIGSDLVVLFITSQTKLLKEKHLVVVKPEEGNGLKVPSRIICSKIATLDAKIVLGELGMVSDNVLSQIEQELRTVLGL